MRTDKIPYSQIPIFSARDKAYIHEVPELKPFYNYEVDLQSFPNIIASRQKHPVDRNTLVDVLKTQYSGILTSQAVLDNIGKLASDNTYTLITAHQPSLFTGPLYYIFKIISLLNLSKKLNATFCEYCFVPVFISGSEDHDFEEVNHLHLFNKTLTWESGEKGAVGKMKTASLQPVLDQLKDTLGTSELASEIFGIIERTHTQNNDFGSAAVALVNELFKEDGLVVLNVNNARLKRLLIPTIKEEILQQSSQAIVNQTIEQLEKVGFPAQARPREINFFYLAEQLRERIIEENGLFKVLNSDYQFTREEMESEIDSHPERFSPNVIMRPLYQEAILPNLAYIGGGGELAYWLERKSQFMHFGLNFPMLIRRNSAIWIDSNSAKRMEKLGLSFEDLMNDTESLIKTYIDRNAEEEFKLDQEKQALEDVFKTIALKTEAVDPTLVKTTWAEYAKTLKAIENLETRLVRAEKHKHENAVQQIRNLKEKLFPGNGLQERYDNFLPFYLKYGRQFFEILKDNFDPLGKDFVVIWDE